MRPEYTVESLGARSGMCIYLNLNEWMGHLGYAASLFERGVLLMPASVYDHPSQHFRIGFGRKNMPEALEKFKHFLKS